MGLPTPISSLVTGSLAPGRSLQAAAMLGLGGYRSWLPEAYPSHPDGGESAGAGCAGLGPAPSLPLGALAQVSTQVSLPCRDVPRHF